MMRLRRDRTIRIGRRLACRAIVGAGGRIDENGGSRPMTSITALAMTDFVREVRARCDGVIDPAEMSRFLAANRIEAASLDGFVRFAPGRYTRHLVHKDRDVEILVLCWARGSTAPIHGHEGEYCWARVERGRLAFASYREASRAPLRLEP